MGEAGGLGVVEGGGGGAGGGVSHSSGLDSVFVSKIPFQPKAPQSHTCQAFAWEKLDLNG